jgi:hypothetical protein
MNTCELCGDLFPECECQSVIANCSTCGTPIFGRDNSGLDVRTVGAYKIQVHTCESCLDEREQRRVA